MGRGQPSHGTVPSWQARDSIVSELSGPQVLGRGGLGSRRGAQEERKEGKGKEKEKESLVSKTDCPPWLGISAGGSIVSCTRVLQV